MFIRLLTGLVNASNHKKCISLGNQKCEIQPTFINLHLMNTVTNYTSIHLELDSCAGTCKTPNDLSSKVCVPNKTEDLNIQVFNMITGKNESKLTKSISNECKCKFDERKCNSNQKWNNDKCWCKCKKHICEKEYILNLPTFSYKNGKYLASIMDDSVIMCDEIIAREAKLFDKETKTVPTNFTKKSNL